MRSVELALGLGLALFLVPSVASAHVGFDTPQDGDVLGVGQTVSITWTDLIPHNTAAYDIDLLVGGQREPVVHDLDPSIHSYDWVVPDEVCQGCMLEIWQRNPDYVDFSDTVTIEIRADAAPSPGTVGMDAGSVEVPDEGDAGTIASEGSKGSNSSAELPMDSSPAPDQMTNDAPAMSTGGTSEAGETSMASEQSSGGCTLASGSSSRAARGLGLVVWGLLPLLVFARWRRQKR